MTRKEFAELNFVNGFAILETEGKPAKITSPSHTGFIKDHEGKVRKVRLWNEGRYVYLSMES